MAYRRYSKWTPPRKSGGIPRVSIIFMLSVGSEQADAGLDGRTRLARSNSQARMGNGKYSFCPVKLTTSRIGNLTPSDAYSVICEEHLHTPGVHVIFL